MCAELERRGVVSGQTPPCPSFLPRTPPVPQLRVAGCMRYCSLALLRGSALHCSRPCTIPLVTRRQHSHPLSPFPPSARPIRVSAPPPPAHCDHHQRPPRRPARQARSLLPGRLRALPARARRRRGGPPRQARETRGGDLPRRVRDGRVRAGGGGARGGLARERHPGCVSGDFAPFVRCMCVCPAPLCALQPGPLPVRLFECYNTMLNNFGRVLCEGDAFVVVDALLLRVCSPPCRGDQRGAGSLRVGQPERVRRCF